MQSQMYSWKRWVVYLCIYTYSQTPIMIKYKLNKYRSQPVNLYTIKIDDMNYKVWAGL